MTAIWRSGDPFRNLTSDALSADAVTVISRSGAARLLDIEHHRHDRIPFEGGRRMMFDGTWRPLRSVRLTPCGLDVDGYEDWARGTPLWAAVTGLHPQWTTTSWGRPIVDAIPTGQSPVVSDHPDEHCGALHCPAPNTAATPALENGGNS